MPPLFSVIVVHSLRDIGMRAARDDHIVHFNADNILYPFALEMIAKEIRRPRLLGDHHERAGIASCPRSFSGSAGARSRHLGKISR